MRCLRGQHGRWRWHLLARLRGRRDGLLLGGGVAHTRDRGLLELVGAELLDLVLAARRRTWITRWSALPRIAL